MDSQNSIDIIRIRWNDIELFCGLWVTQAQAGIGVGERMQKGVG